MDNTRDTLRRGWVYALILAGCIVYGAYPSTQMELALERAKSATSQAVEWIGGHIDRGQK